MKEIFIMRKKINNLEMSGKKIWKMFHSGIHFILVWLKKFGQLQWLTLSQYSAKYWYFLHPYFKPFCIYVTASISYFGTRHGNEREAFLLYFICYLAAS